jgi:L-amino acid N-acyltransferase YncA
MPNYILFRYTTDIKDSIAEAQADLESFIEGMATDNTIIGMGIVSLKRDREKCVGWMLASGVFVMESYLTLVSDSVILTTGP